MIICGRSRRILIPTILAGFLLAACSLADEPAPAGPIETGPLPGETSNLAPASLPDIAAGAQTFADHCAACHGPAGKGDGAQAATITQGGGHVPDLTDPAFVRASSPLAWYETITNGNMPKLMPPWGQSLTDQQRWDVTYYLTTLGATPDSLDRGEAAYASTCLSCHATDGSQNGLTDAAKMAALSPQDIHDQFIVSGTDGVHTFGTKLDDATAWAIVDYVRTFSHSAAPAAVPASPTPGETSAAPGSTPTATEAPAAALGTITGRVSNATPGGAVPADLTVTMSGLELDAQNNVSTFMSRQAPIAADGSFRFEGLPFDRPQSAYIVKATYGGLDFDNIAAADPSKPSLDLPITIYEATSDASAIHLDALHVFFSEHPNSLLVVQVMIFSNSSDRAYVSAQALPGGQTASVTFTLPPDATSISFDSGQLGGRFIQSGTAIYDTQPVLPGKQSDTISVSYIVPYQNARDFTFPMDYPTALVNVLTPVDMELNGSGFVKGAPQSFQGQSLNVYSAQNLTRGQTATFHVGGAASAVDVLRIVLAALLALLVITSVVYFVLRRRMGPAEVPAPSVGGEATAAVLRQIAALDEAYKAGRLNRLDYEARRADLKAQAAESMQGEE